LGKDRRKELNIEQGLTIFDFRRKKSEIANRCVWSLCILSGQVAAGFSLRFSDL